MENKTYGPDTPPKEAAQFLADNYGEECQFTDNIRDDDWIDDYLCGFRDGSFYSSSSIWYYCRLKPKLKRKNWTCETAPDNLMIRKKDWPKGSYVNANVVIDGLWYWGVSSCGETFLRHITYKELDDEWEQRDGSKCYDEGEG